MSERFPNVDWWCDNCNAFLNGQSGFDDNNTEWECAECGYSNSISEDNIVDEYGNHVSYAEDDEDLDQSLWGSDESLSLSDAVDIWLSKGMDEDYTFGYLESELLSAAGIG
ncbi:MAG: Sec23/Sec24 zinc finger-containing protein [Arcanobacterium sp.]